MIVLTRFKNALKPNFDFMLLHVPQHASTL